MKKVIVFLAFLLNGTILLGQPFDNDVGISAILSPLSYQSNSGMIQISITITNYGTQPQTNMIVSYSIDNWPAVIESFPGNLLAGVSMQYIFMTSMNTYLGCHTLTVNIILWTDQNLSNNTKTLNFSVGNPPVTSVMVYPSNLPLWTGTTDSLSFTQNSLVQFRGGGMSMGWMMFDLSSLPGNIAILAAKLRVQTVAPFNSNSFMLKGGFYLSPFTSNPSLMYSLMESESNNLFIHDSFGVGQTLTFDLPASSLWGISQSLNGSLGYYTIGVTENSGSSSKVGTFAGWDQGPGWKPALTITYTNSFVTDVGIFSVDIDTSSCVQGQIIPKVSIQNYGLTNAIGAIALTNDAGYSSTVAIGGFSNGCWMQIVFSPWIAVSGPVCFHAVLSIINDEFCANDKAEFCWDNTFPSTIFGNITYKNSLNSPMIDSTTVLLIPYNPPGIIQVDTMDSNGNYTFENLTPGDYNLQVLSTKAWGGVNASDGLAVLKHFVGMTPLTGLNLVAADVNADGQVNSIDALMILQRFIGMITSFPAGNWVSDQPFITMPPSQYTPTNLKVLCTGDVNGSFVP